MHQNIFNKTSDGFTALNCKDGYDTANISQLFQLFQDRLTIDREKRFEDVYDSHFKRIRARERSAVTSEPPCKY
jgi:hypothetical protein